VKVNREGGDREVLLYGVETPRSGQGFHGEARKFTEHNLMGKTVEVTPIEEDSSGKAIGVVALEGFVLNKELVRSGYAWVNPKLCRRPECNEWLHWQEHAQFLRAGLWSVSNPVPPWEYGKVAQQPAASEGMVYCGNEASRYFHAPGCKYYDNPKCTAHFNSIEEALKAGYKPHPRCIPATPEKTR
jgi:hypothetical protein